MGEAYIQSRLGIAVRVIRQKVKGLLDLERNHIVLVQSEVLYSKDKDGVL